MTLNLVAPAKLNLALEILSRRSDGYHELVSVMQTIDLADHVHLDPASDIEISVTGERTLNVPVEGPRNLAYRAAVAMREEAGRNDLGVRIELEKGIPAGGGLGGGSSDAAAVIRGLNRLWSLDFPLRQLEAVAARLGSDVPFFLHGGAAFVSGRGEAVEPIGDGVDSDFTLFVSPVEIEDKTRRMYSLMSPADCTDGNRVRAAAEALRRGLRLSETDYVNAFDRHIGDVVPPIGRAFAYSREAGMQVITAGSGPSFFSPVALTDINPRVLETLERDYDVTAIPCRSLGRERATMISEVDSRG